MDLGERIIREAERIGFDLAGSTAVAASPHADSLRRWLAAGHAAGMSWMGAREAERVDPAAALPGAKSVVVVGLSYFAGNPPPELWNDPCRGRVARYAWGADYHDVLLPMLRELESFIVAETGTKILSRAYVDTGPVLERDLAERAGLGVAGKNTNVINGRYGSYVFIGEILSEWQVPSAECRVKNEAESCGACERCLSGCPTGALVEPRVLDARKCISYLTIEHRGVIPVELRRAMGNWVFGCDECQQVCPWVIQHSLAGKQRFLKFNPDTCAPKLEDLLALDDASFRERFKGTPVLRAKRSGLVRNAIIAASNSGSAQFFQSLEKLARDTDSVVRETAKWAMADGQ